MLVANENDGQVHGLRATDVGAVVGVAVGAFVGVAVGLDVSTLLLHTYASALEQVKSFHVPD